METPLEYLNVRLTTLKVLGNQRGSSKNKRESRKLIPVFEKAIEVLKEAETSEKQALNIGNVIDSVCVLHDTCPLRDGDTICSIDTDCEDMQTEL